MCGAMSPAPYSELSIVKRFVLDMGTAGNLRKHAKTHINNEGWHNVEVATMTGGRRRMVLNLAQPPVAPTGETAAAGTAPDVATTDNQSSVLPAANSSDVVPQGNEGGDRTPSLSPALEDHQIEPLNPCTVCAARGKRSGKSYSPKECLWKVWKKANGVQGWREDVN
ncbi:MAG: hypothetical protein M1823_004577 [Watsoniomyces obsoletus]|nr:MAG: hypothetical protein M1823_004577 [Watsoniomyces obsoletus]